MEQKKQKKKQHLYSRFTRSPKHPFSVVVKDHATRIILYVTYGGGNKNGGGSWSEDMTRIHPRTLNMILSYFNDSVIEELELIKEEAMKRKSNQRKHRPRKNAKRRPSQSRSPQFQNKPTS